MRGMSDTIVKTVTEKILETLSQNHVKTEASIKTGTERIIGKMSLFDFKAQESLKYPTNEIIESLSQNSYMPEKRHAERGERPFDLIPLNDAIANELMNIRLDLLHVKVEQGMKNWENFPNEFIKIYLLYF